MLEGKQIADTSKLKLYTHKPQDTTSLSAFISYCSFFRNFLENCAEHLRPLYQGIRGKSRASKVDWTPEMEESFYNLQDALQHLPDLQLIDVSEGSGDLHIFADSSSHTISAILCQSIKITKDNGKVTEAMYPLSYFSRGLKGSETSYCISESEIAALSAAIAHWNPYLRLGKTLHCWTDNSVAYHAAKALDNMKFTPSKIVNRLLLSLQGIHHIAHYKASAQNPADYYTRARKAKHGEQLSMFDEPKIKLINKPKPVLPKLNNDGTVQVPHNYQQSEPINVDNLYDRINEKQEETVNLILANTFDSGANVSQKVVNLVYRELGNTDLKLGECQTGTSGTSSGTLGSAAPCTIDRNFNINNIGDDNCRRQGFNTCPGVGVDGARPVHTSRLHRDMSSNPEKSLSSPISPIPTKYFVFSENTPTQLKESLTQMHRHLLLQCPFTKPNIEIITLYLTFL